MKEAIMSYGISGAYLALALIFLWVAIPFVKYCRVGSKSLAVTGPDLEPLRPSKKLRESHHTGKVRVVFHEERSRPIAMYIIMVISCSLSTLLILYFARPLLCRY